MRIVLSSRLGMLTCFGLSVLQCCTTIHLFQLCGVKQDLSTSFLQCIPDDRKFGVLGVLSKWIEVPVLGVDPLW